MIQDIAPHRLYNPYDSSAVPDSEDYVLCYDSGRVLLRAGEAPQLLRGCGAIHQKENNAS